MNSPSEPKDLCCATGAMLSLIARRAGSGTGGGLAYSPVCSPRPPPLLSGPPFWGNVYWGRSVGGGVLAKGPAQGWGAGWPGPQGGGVFSRASPPPAGPGPGAGASTVATAA